MAFQEQVAKAAKGFSRLFGGRQEALREAMASGDQARYWSAADAWAKEDAAAFKKGMERLQESGEISSKELDGARSGEGRLRPEMLLAAMALLGEDDCLSMVVKHWAAFMMAGDRERSRATSLALRLDKQRVALALCLAGPWDKAPSVNQDILNAVSKAGPNEEGRGLLWALSFAVRQGNDVAAAKIIKEGGRGFSGRWTPSAGAHGEPLLTEMIKKRMDGAALELVDNWGALGERGREFLAREKAGETALTEAIRSKSSEVALRVVQLVQGEALMESGRSALMVAMETGAWSIVSEILDNIIFRKGESGKEPVVPGINMGGNLAGNLGQALLAKLARAGADLGENPSAVLQAAIHCGHEELVLALAARAKNPKAIGVAQMLDGVGEDGLGAVAMAARRGGSFGMKVMAALLAAGASANEARKQLEALPETLGADEDSRRSGRGRHWPLGRGAALESLEAARRGKDTLPQAIGGEGELRRKLVMRANTSRKKLEGLLAENTQSIGGLIKKVGRENN